MNKRRIAILATAITAVLTLSLVAIDHYRDHGFDTRLRAWSGPIILAPDPKLGVFAKDLADAVDDLNTATKCTVAKIDSERGLVRVSWIDQEPCRGNDLQPKDKDASYFECRDGTGHIVVRRLFTHEHARILFRHEIGHVTGLAHDNSGFSVMISPPAYTAVPAPTWTPKDVAAIRQRYCK